MLTSRIPVPREMSYPVLRSPLTPVTRRLLVSVSNGGDVTLIYCVVGKFWLGPCKCESATSGTIMELPDAYVTPGPETVGVLFKGATANLLVVDVDTENADVVEVTRIAPSIPTFATVGCLTEDLR